MDVFVPGLVFDERGFLHSGDPWSWRLMVSRAEDYAELTMVVVGHPGGVVNVRLDEMHLLGFIKALQGACGALQGPPTTRP